MDALTAFQLSVANVARCIPFRGDATLATPKPSLRSFQMQRLQRLSRLQRWAETNGLDTKRRAVNDSDLFLNFHAASAAAQGCMAANLFDVPNEGRHDGLVWWIDGHPLQAIGPTSVLTLDGREFKRGLSLKIQRYSGGKAA